MAKAETPSALLARIAAVGGSGALAAGAVFLFIHYSAPDGHDVLDFARMLLVALSTFWIGWGASTAVLGLFAATPHRPWTDEMAPARGRTAILIPIYNEDPAPVFSRVAAMNASLVKLGLADRFDFAVLSDTTAMDVAAEEVVWFQRLLEATQGQGRMFYRRREANIGKKAGNIEDFVRRSGSAYDYAIILDADSLLEGSTMAEMVNRMEADPELGLLQTVPKIIGAQSLFGRVIQFCANYYGPTYSSGLALLQGREGPFWGHNAIVRMNAFAASCGLPVLSGKPPHGGHILSHDYVEAALLARNGWKVRLDPDLGGSYEEGPENLVEFAKRDRRWCQGNLQHRRLLMAPGFHMWNRFVFLQGIMSYLGSPLWLMFLIFSMLDASILTQPSYISMRLLPASVLAGWALLGGTFVLLTLPKFLIVLRGALTGENRRYGGTFKVIASVLAEIALSSLVAPVMLAIQTRSVFQVLFGLDGGWPATRRSESRVRLGQAWVATSWLVVAGSIGLVIVLALAPASLAWALPVAGPMILAPLVIAGSSRSNVSSDLFVTEQERSPSPAIRERQWILSSWMGESAKASLHMPAIPAGRTAQA